MAASISHFVSPTTKFSCCSSNKKNVSFYLSLALDLCRPFSCWASLACRLLSLFLCLSLALYSKFVDLAITLDNTDTERISAFRFVFIDSLVVSALQDAGGYAISRQNNLELHLGCHTCWLSYFTLVCLCCGRTVVRSVYGQVITKFSGMDRFSYLWCSAASPDFMKRNMNATPGRTRTYRIPVFLPYHYITTPTRQNTEKFKYIN